MSKDSQVEEDNNMYSYIGKDGLPIHIKPPQKRKSGELPWRFQDANNFRGYDKPQVHPRFWTTSSDYGSRGPTESSLPEKYFGANNEFSKARVISGNYKNHSLNI